MMFHPIEFERKHALLNQMKVKANTLAYYMILQFWFQYQTDLSFYSGALIFCCGNPACDLLVRFPNPTLTMCSFFSYFWALNTIRKWTWLPIGWWFHRCMPHRSSGTLNLCSVLSPSRRRPHQHSTRTHIWPLSNFENFGSWFQLFSTYSRSPFKSVIVMTN